MTLSFIIPLLFIIGATGTALTFFKYRFEQILPLTLMASALTLYLSGLFGSLLPGLWIVIVWACLFPVGLLVTFLKDRDLFRRLLSRFLTPGFCIFLLLYLIVFILDYRRGLGWWDEYSHWAPMAKETFRLNAFFCSPGSALTFHMDYPPVVTLFEYLWCKLCGGYDVTFLYRSLHVLCFSLFGPVLGWLEWPDGVERKKWGRIMAQLALTATVIFVSCGIVPMECDFYTSIYNDAFLGLLLAFCFSCILFWPSGSVYQVVSLCVALTFMTLTKQIAAYFVALCACLFLVQLLVERHKAGAALPKERGSLLRSLLSVFLITAIPVAFFLSWQYILRVNGISSGMETAQIQWSQLPGILLDRSGELFQRLTVINFKAAFFSRALGTHPVDLSFFQVLFLFLGVFTLFIWHSKRKDTGLAPERLSGFTVIAILGGVGYAFVLLITYIYHFGAYEAPRLASYERYIGSYILALTTLTVMLILRLFARWQKSAVKNATALMLLVLCGLMVCMPPAKCASLSPSLQAYPLSRDYVEDYTAILNKTEEDASILLVTQGDSGLVGHIIRYETLPRTIDSISLGLPKYDGDVWTENLSPDAFTSVLERYDYLYLYHVDDTFTQRYISIFQTKDAIQEKSLYAIIKDGQGCVLKAR